MTENNLQTHNIDSKKLINVEEFEINTRIQVQPEKTVKKVISVESYSTIISSERVGDNLSFSGKTNYQIVYLTEEDKITSVIKESEWKHLANLNSNGECFVKAFSKENTVVDSSATEIVVASLVNIEIYTILSNTINALSNFNDDCVVKEKEYSYNKLVNIVQDNFSEISEQEVDFKVEEVLYNQVNVSLSNVVTGVDSLIIEGELNIASFVLVGEKVIRIDKVNNFRHECSALSATIDNVVDIDVFVSGVKVTLSNNEIDNKTNLIYSTDLGVNAVIYSIEKCCLVEDIFSTKKELTLNTECLLNETFFGGNSLTTSVASTFLTENKVDDILFLKDAQVNVFETTFNDDVCLVNGVVDFDFACLLDNRDVVNIHGVVPFLQSVEINLEDKVSANVQNVSYRLKNENEIEVELKICFSSKQIKEEYITFVNSIQEGENRESDNDAIIVYIVKKDESLFDIAKHLCVKPDEIIKQNNLEDGVVYEGMRLTVYVPLDINF